MIASEPIRFFSGQPRQLFWVMGIAIIGGLLAFLFSRLSLRTKRKVKLVVVGLTATLLPTFYGYIAYQLAKLFVEMRAPEVPVFVFLKVMARSLGASALLWILFYRIYRNRVT
jgi:hypothetical protein